MIEEAIEQYQQHSQAKLKLKAVLFDMDGVLFDSMPNHTLSWYQAISELGIECSRDEFYLFEGATGAYTINRLFNINYGRDASEEEKEQIYKRKTMFFNALPKAKPMPFAFDILEKVKQAGLIPVLVTGSGQKSLIDRLNIHFPGVFASDKMVTAFDVIQGKPHPEPYLKGLSKCGIKPYEAIVIENAPLGVKSAFSAGIFTIAVNTGPIDDQILLDAGANYLFDSIEQLYLRWDQFSHLISS
ncbi:MAG: HAD-IA family hydrolase [Bacteroidales bacterium]|nr:HAD-IA family hydrolase [Bacteroidales bacterium]